MVLSFLYFFKNWIISNKSFFPCLEAQMNTTSTLWKDSAIVPGHLTPVNNTYGTNTL